MWDCRLAELEVLHFANMLRARRLSGTAPSAGLELGQQAMRSRRSKPRETCDLIFNADPCQMKGWAKFDLLMLSQWISLQYVLRKE